jgi:DNA modification methylase
VKAWLDDGDVRLYHGHTLEVLRAMPDASVDCIVTSPPYYGLRDYGVEGQIGLEATPAEFIAVLVDVFRECRRVLADHGNLWVNMGSSYAGDVARRGGASDGRLGRARPGSTDHGSACPDLKALSNRGTSSPLRSSADRTQDTEPLALAYLYSTIDALAWQQKDLLPTPWLLGLALQADGWILRKDNIWAKRNCMPESATDRTTSAHEYVFHLVKRPRYFYDADAVREVSSHPELVGKTQRVDYRPDGVLASGRPSKTVVMRSANRNLRSVWEIATQPTPEAHFATYPEELVRRCVLAGCPGWVCETCGKPRERIVEARSLNRSELPREHPEWRPRRYDDGKAGDPQSPGPGQRFHESKTTGWSDCGHNAYRRGVVLDPFIGSGTTCKVARDHGRHGVGIDLSAEYLRIAAKRLQQLSLITGEGAA